MKIDGISALVTGAGSGLGRATAELLAERGARVIAVDLAGGESRGPIEFVAADVRDPEGVAAAVERADQGGELRVCVNCAGVGDSGRTVGRDGPLDLDTFRRVVEINLLGTFNVIRLAAARWPRAEPLDGGERGVIVNTASIAAFDGQIGQAAYAASKGGIVGMTLPIARDLARSRIRVMTIAPGLFDTPMFDTCRDAGPRGPRRLRAPPGPPRRPARVRRPGRPHRREPRAQRRDHPPRRRRPHAPALAAMLMGRKPAYISGFRPINIVLCANPRAGEGCPPGGSPASATFVR